MQKEDVSAGLQLPASAPRRITAQCDNSGVAQVPDDSR